MSPETTRSSLLAETVESIVATAPIRDIHTHLYDPAFGELLLWGIDELLVYHYLVAEAFRQTDLPYEKFWALSKVQQAEQIWDALFIQNSPISEACRGILTTLHALGLDVKKRDLRALRQWFKQWKVEDYITRCMELAGVESICMTNSPFDDLERPVWEKGFAVIHSAIEIWLFDGRHPFVLLRCISFEVNMTTIRMNWLVSSHLIRLGKCRTPTIHRYTQHQ
jgi:hypothetical protein